MDACPAGKARSISRPERASGREKLRAPAWRAPSPVARGTCRASRRRFRRSAYVRLYQARVMLPGVPPTRSCPAVRPPDLGPRPRPAQLESSGESDLAGFSPHGYLGQVKHSSVGSRMSSSGRGSGSAGEDFAEPLPRNARGMVATTVSSSFAVSRLSSAAFPVGTRTVKLEGIFWNRSVASITIDVDG